MLRFQAMNLRHHETTRSGRLSPRSRLLACFAACAALVCLTCASDDLPESFRLEGLRVLAILADQPEVNPGDTVMLTPLLSDIAGAGRALVFSAQACVDPGVGFGAEPTCDGSATFVDLATNQPATGLAAPNYTGLLTPSLQVTVPGSGVMFSGRASHDQFNGVDYLVTFQFKTPDGQTLRAFKRILVSSRTTKHQNPTFASTQLLSNGVTVTSLPASETPIHVDVATSSSEVYQEQRASGTLEDKVEKIETFWFISDGDLTTVITDGSAATSYTPPETPPTDHGVVIMAVVRDSRGGQAALVFNF